MSRPTPLVVPLALSTTVTFAAPVAAHGSAATADGLAFSAVVLASIGASLLGGGSILALTGVDGVPRVGPALLVVLGAFSVALAHGRSLTDCGACADATLSAVTLHRGFEGVVLATVYVADATLGLVGAGVLAVHAAAETAAVGALYATTRRYAVAAVCLLQVGFVAGVAAGWSVVDVVPPAAETGLLALVGGVLLTAGTREGYHRYADRLAAVAV